MKASKGSLSSRRVPEIGLIPEDWEVVKLEEVADEIYYGITAKGVNYKTKLKMIRTTDITNYHVDWSTIPYCEVTEKRSDLSKYYLRQNDIIVARAGTVGVSVLIEKDMEDVIFGSYLIKIRVSSKVYPKFLHYFFQSKFYWQHLQKAQGSTLKNINLPLLKSLLIPLPPLPEQKKIAEILRTVDGAIEKVDETIERTERLKKGLMQELLTKGIGHREFKDAEIGRIPKEWEVVKLGDIRFFKLIMGQSPPSSTYNKSGIGIPFLQGCAEFGKIYPSPNLYCSKPLKIVRLGDILISVRAPVGEINIADTNLCIGRGLAALRPKEKSVNTFYIYYALHKAKGKLKNRSSGSTFKAIAKRDLENFQIPLPPLPEQKQIAKILMTVDKKLELLREKKKTLEQLKKGLMNGLLTGRRRVKVEPPKETLF